TNDLLAAAVTAHDPDGDAITLTYEWSRNGSVLAGAAGSSLDLSRPGNGDRGDTIVVRVVAGDGQASSLVASASLVVADTAPVASATLSSAAPSTSAVLTATASATDSDADPLTFTFTWKVNGLVR